MDQVRNLLFINIIKKHRLERSFKHLHFSCKYNQARKYECTISPKHIQFHPSSNSIFLKHYLNAGFIPECKNKSHIFKRFNKDNINEMKHKSGPGIPSHIHIFLTNKEKVKKTCIMNFKKKREPTKCFYKLLERALFSTTKFGIKYLKFSLNN